MKLFIVLVLVILAISLLYRRVFGARSRNAADEFSDMQIARRSECAAFTQFEKTGE